MKMEAFLEKKEKYQVLLLKKLIEEGGTVSYAKMLAFLGISRGSLDSYLDGIADKLVSYQGACRLIADGQMMSLELSSVFSIERLYQDYMVQSVTYEIMDYLFLYREFTVVKLTSKLALSESSLFRKIKEINVNLKEFKLQIKNGSLQGEELQIRYFYFLMYWSAVPYQDYQAKPIPHQQLRLISALEKELELHFTEYNRLRISLWLQISKKRASVTTKNYTKVKQKMQPYQRDSLYHKIRKLVFLYFSRYAIEVSEEESMLHFIFLTTFSILTEADFSMYDLIRGRRTPNAIVDTLIKETVLLYYRPRKPTIALDAKISYYVSQINGRLYFFEGVLECYDHTGLLKPAGNYLNNKQQPLSQVLLDIALTHYQQKAEATNSLQQVSELNYRLVLALVDVQIARELKIGIDLQLVAVYEEFVRQMLVLSLKNISGITVENYQLKGQYDLVITNSFPSTNYGQHVAVYMLSDRCSQYDLGQIKLKIQQLKEL